MLTAPSNTTGHCRSSSCLQPCCVLLVIVCWCCRWQGWQWVTATHTCSLLALTRWSSAGTWSTTRWALYISLYTRAHAMLLMHAIICVHFCCWHALLVAPGIRLHISLFGDVKAAIWLCVGPSWLDAWLIAMCNHAQFMWVSNHLSCTNFLPAQSWFCCNLFSF